MRIDQLYYVLEAVKTGSFTKAADNLYMKQPSLRTAITNLENELGFKIFVRTKTGVYLTPQGNKYLPNMKEIIHIYQFLKSDHLTKKDSLQIGVGRYFSGYMEAAYKTFRNYMSLGNDTCIDCTFTTSHSNRELVKKILKGELNMAFISYFPSLLKSDHWLSSQMNYSIKFDLICNDELTVIMDRTHPLAKQKKVSIDMLKSYLLIFFSDASIPSLEVLKKQVEKNSLSIMTLSMGEIALALQFIHSKKAIAFITSSHSKASYNNVTYKKLEGDYIQNVGVVYPQKKVSHEMLAFIRAVDSVINKP
jgi:DNA-binding transcriptional LysR family regulator